MSFEKVAELAAEFTIKIAENQFAEKAPEAQAFINSLSKKDNNQAQDVNDIDEKVWKRAKKVVKPYWKKYDEPWAVVYDVYRKMGGKTKKKSKKK